MEIEVIWRAWFRRSLYNTLIGNRKLREREREKERLRAHETLWLQPRFFCVCVCVCVCCGEGLWFFPLVGEGELIDKLFNTHEGKKNVFFPSCNCDLFWVLFFCFCFSKLFVWVECVLVGERKKKRKRKKNKNKKTEQAVEGKGGVKMVWLRMYWCLEIFVELPNGWKDWASVVVVVVFLQKNCLFWGCAVGEFSPFRVLVFLHVRFLDILCDLVHYSKQFAVVCFCLLACQS